MTKEEKKVAQRAATARWLAKPGNREKHRAAVAICRKRPHAKEAHRDRARLHASKNRDREKKRTAEWRKNNPDKAIETHRIYYLKNRDCVRAANKAYREANRQAYREYSRQYKAAKRAGGGRLSSGYFKRLMAEQYGKCPACECDLLIAGTHLDHIIPITKGGQHCDENVQLLCPDCNRRKGAKNYEDFLRIINQEAA